MTGFAHGLLIGKFYPPHLGHHAAIRAAAVQCGRLSVVVMASAAETIPLADRVAWLRAEHTGDAGVTVVGVRCGAPLDLTDPLVWAAQVAVMRSAARAVTPAPVDVVFCGDAYGKELARWFGAAAVFIGRAPGSPSGTAVRQDLAMAWPDLAPATRAGLVTRAVFVGAESTGTTTVSRTVAEQYRARGGVWTSTRWVPEYGREHTQIIWTRQRARAEAAGRPAPALGQITWDAADFDAVAGEQTRREHADAAGGSPLLLCDTDALATSVWERRYLGTAARDGQPWSRPPLLPRRDVYLLTDHHDVPWHDDGLREGDLAVRAAMTDWFADTLTAAGQSWVLLTGTVEQRVALSVRTLDQLLRHRSRFARPLQGPGFRHCA